MPVLASDVVAGARSQMLAQDLAHDTADKAGTDFRILRQLGDDVAQEGVAVPPHQRQ